MAATQSNQDQTTVAEPNSKIEPLEVSDKNLQETLLHGFALPLMATLENRQKVFDALTTFIKQNEARKMEGNLHTNPVLMAKYFLGDFYLQGFGIVPPDYELARKIFTELYETGSLYGAIGMGRITSITEFPDLGVKNSKYYAQYYNLALQQNLLTDIDNAGAFHQYTIGTCLKYGDGVPVNTVDGNKLIVKALSKGSIMAAVAVSRQLSDEQNYLLAYNVIEPLLAVQSVVVDTSFARYHLLRKSLYRDVDKAIQILDRAAITNNFMVALVQLAIIYLHGCDCSDNTGDDNKYKLSNPRTVILSDYIVAEKYLLKAKNLGNSHAYYLLGKLYSRFNLPLTDDQEKLTENKDDVKGTSNENSSKNTKEDDKKDDKKNLKVYDPEKAIELLKEAANKEVPPACTALGNLYSLGKGVSRNGKLAFEYFNKAKDLGDPEAHYYIALCYIDGDGVDEDKAKGYEIAMQALQSSGEPRAVGLVAYCCFYGIGRTKHLSSAETFANYAARRGITPSMWILAYVYASRVFSELGDENEIEDDEDSENEGTSSSFSTRYNSSWLTAAIALTLNSIDGGNEKASEVYSNIRARLSKEDFEAFVKSATSIKHRVFDYIDDLQEKIKKEKIAGHLDKQQALARKAPIAQNQSIVSTLWNKRWVIGSAIVVAGSVVLVAFLMRRKFKQ